jgi:DNA processing protein
MSEPLPTPPKTAAEALDWLRLIRSPRIGPVTFRRLMAEHGSAAAALVALPQIAKAASTDGYEACSIARAEAEYAAGLKVGARLLALGEAAYPNALCDLHDAPPLLWAFGDVDLAQRSAVAIVGARNASALGLRMARILAKGLGKSEQVVVSGLARGIDAAAHEAAMETGTIAVLAGGVDVPYPAENAALARQIYRHGLLLSEQPMGLQPQARHFPRRNRLISGLGQALVVVEAAVKSGSLITARDALDQGREVMAVPAHPFDARSGGSNQLIRDGALLVRGTNDILAALPHTAATERHEEVPAVIQAPVPGTDVRSAILTCLAADPVAEHLVSETTQIPSDVIAHHLTELELEGVVARQPGGLVARVA